ncbi:MAG: hypothetical protein ABEK03_07935 [Candidatus Bipolaricaulia bacterium]
MKPRYAALIGTCLALGLVFGVVLGHAQDDESDDPWRLIVQADITADLQNLTQAPKLTIDARLEGDLGELGIGLSQDLAQTDSLEFRFHESLKHREWRFGASLDWRPKDIPTVGLTLGWRPSWGQAQLKLNAPPSPLTWELTGRYRGNQLRINLHKLTGTLTTATLNRATLDWSPDFTSMSFGGRINRSQSPPLALEMNVPLPHDANLRTTHRYSLDDGLSSWRSTTLTAQCDPVRASVDLDAHGWQAVSATWQRDLDEAWAVSTGLIVEPGGWQESDLELTWQPGLTNELSGEITLRSDGWTVSPSVNWRTDQPSTSVNGSFVLDPEGLGSARVNADASLGPLSMSGFFNRTGSSWMLDLSGKLSQRPWQLSAQGSWLARLGFDGGSMQLGRDWSWPVPPLIR